MVRVLSGGPDWQDLSDQLEEWTEHGRSRLKGAQWLYKNVMGTFTCDLNRFSTRSGIDVAADGNTPGEALEAAIRKLRDAEARWNPIATAPKDGTPILACYPSYDHAHHLSWHPITVHWATFHPNAPGKGTWKDASGHKRDTVTHWMPCPPAPKAER